MRFAKMHGLGNDFMVIDGIHQEIDARDLPVKAWADRHTGIGFDQLLLLLPSKHADVACRIFNADGSEARQCGNGMRCVARFLKEGGHVTKETLAIETLGGIVQARLLADGRVEVAMGVPHLQKDPLNLALGLPSLPRAKVFTLALGNPHAILKVETLKGFPVKLTGQAISTHAAFSDGINVGFMQVVDAHTLCLETYERGAGATLACGSNACAAATVAITHFGGRSPVIVHVTRGTLEVIWENPKAPVLLRGEADLVFSGVIEMSPKIM